MFDLDDDKKKTDDIYITYKHYLSYKVFTGIFFFFYLSFLATKLNRRKEPKNYRIELERKKKKKKPSSTQEHATFNGDKQM